MRIASIARLSMLAAVLSALAGTAMAAPQYDGAARSPISVDEFASQVSVFNPADIDNLLGASTVKTVKVGSGWNGVDDNSTAHDLLDSASPAIAELRTALRDDPAAAALLGKLGVSPSQVVDIYNDAGNVAIFVE